jgi:hypothetical protein
MRPFILFALLLLAACAEVPRPVPLAPGVALTLPAPGELGRVVEAFQVVTATRGGEVSVFESRLATTPDEVRLVTTDPLGRRALAIRWTAAGVEEDRAAWVPVELRAENVLADLVLLYWPDAAIRRGLSGASLEGTAGGRGIWTGDGEVVTVRHEGSDPWSGVSRLENRAWGYALDVRSAVMGP